MVLPIPESLARPMPFNAINKCRAETHETQVVVDSGKQRQGETAASQPGSGTGQVLRGCGVGVAGRKGRGNMSDREVRDVVGKDGAFTGSRGTAARKMRELLRNREGVPEWGTRLSEIERKRVSIGGEPTRRIMEQADDKQTGVLPRSAGRCDGRRDTGRRPETSVPDSENPATRPPDDSQKRPQ